VLTVSISPTRQIIDLVTPTGTVQARVWTGKSAGGVDVQVLVTRIAAHDNADQTELEAELTELPGPIPDHQAFPLRMVL
jgi:hypothetical protein